MIGKFKTLYPAELSLIVGHICVNRRLKTRLVNGGVFLGHYLKCLFSVCGRRQNTENECNVWLNALTNCVHRFGGGGGVRKITQVERCTQNMTLAYKIYAWYESNNFHSRSLILSFITFDCFKLFSQLQSPSTIT